MDHIIGFGLNLLQMINNDSSGSVEDGLLVQGERPIESTPSAVNTAGVGKEEVEVAIQSKDPGVGLGEGGQSVLGEVGVESADDRVSPRAVNSTGGAVSIVTADESLQGEGVGANAPLSRAAESSDESDSDQFSESEGEAEVSVDDTRQKPAKESIQGVANESVDEAGVMAAKDQLSSMTISSESHMMEADESKQDEDEGSIGDLEVVAAKDPHSKEATLVRNLTGLLDDDESNAGEDSKPVGDVEVETAVGRVGSSAPITTDANEPVGDNHDMGAVAEADELSKGEDNKSLRDGDSHPGGAIQSESDLSSGDHQRTNHPSEIEGGESSSSEGELSGMQTGSLNGEGIPFALGGRDSGGEYRAVSSVSPDDRALAEQIDDKLGMDVEGRQDMRHSPESLLTVDRYLALEAENNNEQGGGKVEELDAAESWAMSECLSRDALLVAMVARMREYGVPVESVVEANLGPNEKLRRLFELLFNQLKEDAAMIGDLKAQQALDRQAEVVSGAGTLSGDETMSVAAEEVEVPVDHVVGDSPEGSAAAGEGVIEGVISQQKRDISKRLGPPVSKPEAKQLGKGRKRGSGARRFSESSAAFPADHAEDLLATYDSQNRSGDRKPSRRRSGDFPTQKFSRRRSSDLPPQKSIVAPIKESEKEESKAWSVSPVAEVTYTAANTQPSSRSNMPMSSGWDGAGAAYGSTSVNWNAPAGGEAVKESSFSRNNLSAAQGMVLEERSGSSAALGGVGKPPAQTPFPPRTQQKPYPVRAMKRLPSPEKHVSEKEEKKFPGKERKLFRKERRFPGDKGKICGERASGSSPRHEKRSSITIALAAAAQEPIICEKGARVSDRQPVPPYSPGVCKEYFNCGRCRRKNCGREHKDSPYPKVSLRDDVRPERFKGPKWEHICIQLFEEGECFYGNRCDYVHPENIEALRMEHSDMIVAKAKAGGEQARPSSPR